VTFSDDLLHENWDDGSVAAQVRLRLWRHLRRGMRVRRTMAGLLRARAADVVYASQPFAWGCATPVARRFGARVVWRIGGPVVAGGRYGRAILRQWAARHPPDAMVTCSHEIAGVFAPLLPVPITVIPNGVDLRHFRPARTDEAHPRPPDGAVTVGCAARMIESKGVGDLLTAMAGVVRTTPTVRLLLAGDGPQASTFRRHAVALGVDGVTRFLGFVTDMRAFYAACDLFVLPSYAEGQANVLLEAMAMGVPVVTTDLPGTRELIEDGEHGVLVPRGDPAALGIAVARLCHDAVERRRLATSALAHVRAHLDAHDAARTLALTFDAVCGTGAPAIVRPRPTAVPPAPAPSTAGA
jgi:glycosyltransferase involved in cell wall biosynthesis